MRISDWSSDVCSSDLGRARAGDFRAHIQRAGGNDGRYARPFGQHHGECGGCFGRWPARNGEDGAAGRARRATRPGPGGGLSMGYWLAKTEHQMKRGWRSEEHTSELQSLMRISYAVFCLKKKNSNHKQLRDEKNPIA